MNAARNICPEFDMSSLQRGPVSSFAPAFHHQGEHNIGRDFTKHSHLTAVPSGYREASLLPRHETYDVESAMTSPTRARKFQEQKPIHTIDESDFKNVVKLALRSHYGNDKSAIKSIAKDSGASYGSAKNWHSGITTPHALYMERLKDLVPGLDAEMRRLRAMEADLNPDFQREFTRLMQTMMRAGQV